jgi:hypothetical protein
MCANDTQLLAFALLDAVASVVAVFATRRLTSALVGAKGGVLKVANV